MSSIGSGCPLYWPSATHALEEARDLFEHPDRPPALAGQRSCDAAGPRPSLARRRTALGSLGGGASSARGCAWRAFPGRRHRCRRHRPGGGCAMAFAACRWFGHLGSPPSIWPARTWRRALLAAASNFRLQDVTRFDEVAGYSLTWLPTPFLSQDAARTALDRLTAALRPKGYLVVGLYGPPAEPIGAALAALRLARSGGHLWDCHDMAVELRSRGFTAVETCRGQPVSLVMGQGA